MEALNHGIGSGGRAALSQEDNETHLPPATPSARFARDAQELAQSAESGTRTLANHVASLLGLDCGDNKSKIFEPERRDAVPFGLRRRFAVGLAAPGRDQCRTPSACGLCLRQPPADEGGIAVDFEDGGLTQPVAGPFEDVLADPPVPSIEHQLRQVRRAVAQVALDLMAEMTAIDECFARILREDPRAVSRL